MSTPTTHELRALHAIADDLREEFGARVHGIDAAIDRDAAFDRGYIESSLARGLVEDAVLQAATRRGVIHPDVPGGGFELAFIEGLDERRYRVRKAKRRMDGSLYVATNNSSGLTPADGYPEEPRLIELSQWVFAVVRDTDGLIAEVVAAEVVDAIEGRPGRLVFGQQIPLGAGGEPPSAIGFHPPDEDLDGFETDEDDEDFGEAAS